MNHKTYFTQKDYERAFLSGSFRNGSFVAETFAEIFSENPPEKIIHMSNTQLERLVNRISRSEKVKKMQLVIAEEREEGEASLNALADIVFAQLQKPRLSIAPANKDNIYTKRYEEWWAYCGSDADAKKNGLVFEPPMPIAKGLFHPSSMPLEKITFTPENTFYSDLPSLFRNGEFACGHGSLDVRLKKVATAHVYRDKATDAELSERVRAVFQGTADGLYASQIKSQEKRYEKAELDITNKLHEIFKSLKAGDKINYKKVYKIFECILRENFDIAQLIDEPELRGIMMQEIEKNIKLPYAVIRTRVKDPFSEFLKILSSLYNLNKGDEKTKVKSYEDRNGFRAVIKDEGQIFALQRELRNVIGFEILKEDDYITFPKLNGYRSLHIVLNWGGVSYDGQLRTHGMDRDQEMALGQSHDAILIKKLESLNNTVHDNVKLVVATVYGVFNREL